MAVSAFALGVNTAELFHNHPSGLLVGYGCEKSDGNPVFFPEEDMFPSCSKIEEWKED